LEHVLSSLVDDVVFEERLSLEEILAGYWYLRAGYERALNCKNAECFHAELDIASVKASYEEQLASMCHEIVALIDGAM
jgi:hypothetical protein